MPLGSWIVFELAPIIRDEKEMRIDLGQEMRFFG
jgi:hypothetical protein